MSNSWDWELDAFPISDTIPGNASPSHAPGEEGADAEGGFAWFASLPTLSLGPSASSSLSDSMQQSRA